MTTTYPHKLIEIEGFEFPQYGSLTPLEAMAIAELVDEYLPHKESGAAFLRYKFGIVTLAMQRNNPDWTIRQTESPVWPHPTGDVFVTIETINAIYEFFKTEMEGRKKPSGESDPKKETAGTGNGYSSDSLEPIVVTTGLASGAVLSVAQSA